MVKKQSTSKTSIQKKDFFLSVVMALHLTNEIYQKYENIIKSWSYSKNWDLKKQKGNETGMSYIIIKPKSDLSADNVLKFIQEIKCMLIDMQENMLEEELFEVEDYTNIEYLGSNESNSLLSIYRFSNMLIINIMSENAVKLHNEDPEMAQDIFGNYGIEGDKFLNVRLSYGESSEGFFSKIKNLFSRN